MVVHKATLYEHFCHYVMSLCLSNHDSDGGTLVSLRTTQVLKMDTSLVYRRFDSDMH